MTFEEAWKLVEPVGTWDALLEDGARALWKAAMALGPNRHFVEIGCHRGRSSTLWMLLAKQHGHALTFIDPWAEPPGDAPEAAIPWFTAMRQHNYPFTLICAKTEQIDPRQYPRSIDFLYVDGNHTLEAVEIDRQMIENVNPGGIVAFDNYGTHNGVAFVADRLLKEGKLIGICVQGIVLITRKP